MVGINIPEVPKNIFLYGKLKGHNPGGSVKDRPAYQMVSEAMKRGELDKDAQLVEATSGNTRIALAMVDASYRLPIKIFIPVSATKERVDTMRAYGAEVILTDYDKTIEYSRTLAEQTAKENGYFILNQFSSLDNPAAQY
jgi:cysteine synthase B